MIKNRFGYDVGMEFIRHMIDLGRLYFFSVRTAASASPLIYHLKTGANRVSISLSLDVGAKTTIDIIEAPTITADGTAEKIYNHNRNFKDDDLTAKFFIGATYTGGTGTVIRKNQSGFGTSPGLAASGASLPGSGYQLKPNTSYVFLITPNTNDTIFIGELFEAPR